MGLEKHQQDAYNALCEMDDNLKKFSTLINIPTGGGKTRIAVEFCKKVLKEKCMLIWIAGRIELLIQAIESFIENEEEDNFQLIPFVEGVNSEDFVKTYQLLCSTEYTKEKSKDEDIAEVYKNSRVEDISVDSDILFFSTMTLANIVERHCEKFKNWLDKSQQEEKKLYIIYDEAHHIGASSAHYIFEQMISEFGKPRYRIKRFGLIGLTATVYRGDKYIDVFHTWFKNGWDYKKNALVNVDTLYGDTHAFAKLSKEEREEALNNRIEPAKIEDLFGIRLVKPELIKVEEFSRGDLTPIEEVQYLADRIKKHYKGWGKTVVYVSRGKMAKKLVELLNENGVPAFKYTSPVKKKEEKKNDDEKKNSKKKTKILGDYSVKDDSDKDIEKEQKAFRDFCGDSKADYNVLVAVQKLDEGIDIPDLETIYMYEPTQSHIILRQRVGRVLRKPKTGEKKARVIWQKYSTNKGTVTLENLLSTDFSETPQIDSEIMKDVRDWKIGEQLPAGMYLKPLTFEGITNVFTLSRFTALEILSLFTAKEIKKSESVGWYYNMDNPEGERIYVLDNGRKGYNQLAHMLNSDEKLYFRCSKIKCSNFDSYAKGLGVSSEVMLNDIKRVCFYLVDAKKTDMNGKHISPRLRVVDSEIKKFCEWFFANKLAYAKADRNVIKSIIEEDSKNQSNEGNDVEKASDNQSVQESSNDKLPTDIKEILSGKTSEGFKEQVIEHYTSLQDNKKDVLNKPKQYTDLLQYTNEKKQYQELESLREIMRSGAVRRGYIKNGKYAYAYTYQDDKGNMQDALKVKHIWIDEGDSDNLWLYATALVNVPNHIYVSKEDAEDYASVMREVLDKNLIAGRESQAVQEFMMALGYHDNDNIIREQCRLTKVCKGEGARIPRLLQYMVYEKIYRALLEIVKYDVQNCSNQKELEDTRDEKLAFYKIQLDNDLTPVKDVIYDYRSYLKAVPYYQGIKPEFLCRMVNDIVQMLPNASEIETYVDAFGGSGACTMNAFYKDKNRQRVYNDLGIMNASMYRCLVNDIDKFAEAIEEVFSKAFSNYKADDNQGWFFDKYIAYVKERKARLENEKEQSEQTDDDKEKIKKISEQIKQYGETLEDLRLSVEDFEKIYCNAYEKKRIKMEGSKNPNSEYYYPIETRLKKEYPVGFAPAMCRRVEAYMHTFALKVYRLYHILLAEKGYPKDVKPVRKKKDDYNISLTQQDVGLIFFFGNTLSDRHFYCNCTFRKLISTMLSYRSWLEYGKSCFSGVGIEREDALELMDYEEYNKASTVFYADIPYETTGTNNYVPGWFNTKKFFETLSKCEGTYIVSSRCNVCVPDRYARAYKGITIKQLNKKRPDLQKYKQNVCVGPVLKKFVYKKKKLVKKLNKKRPDLQKYKQNVCVGPVLKKFVYKKRRVDKNIELMKFFISFLSDTFKYRYLIKELGIKSTQIEDVNKARYVFFPYTNSTQVFTKGGKRVGFKKVSVISEEYVERMLVSTHYTNVPVEVMITNADIKLDEVLAYKYGEVYAIPTFKTGVDSTQYKAEPVVIAMEYQKFIDILFKVMFKDEWIANEKREEEKNIAAAFRKLYANRRAQPTENQE